MKKYLIYSLLFVNMKNARREIIGWWRNGVIVLAIILLLVGCVHSSKLTKITDELRLERKKEVKSIDEYDVRILEIDKQLASTSDKANKKNLKTEKRNLITKREKLLKDTYRSYKKWNREHRRHVPF